MKALLMRDFLTETPAVFILFGMSLWFFMYQLRKLNELSE